MAEIPANTWRTTLKRRLVVIAAVFFAWSVAIEARLIYLQIFRHADLSARAERQQSGTEETPAKRGEILDRNGRVLAQDVDADTVYAIPGEIENPAAAAAALCGALQDCTARERQLLAERIQHGPRGFVYVRRQVTPDQARRMAELQLTGIGFIKENQRRYPNRDLAAHLLGYVGIDNTGLSGIEATYDSLIKGRPGTILIQTDARRQAFSRGGRPATTGSTLELTIDQYLQHVAERELSAGVRRAGAASGSAIVMDPQTGEILALANYPTFNPNAFREFTDNDRRNRAVQDLYEPGSTFKIVTASAGFEERVVSPSTIIDASAGLIRIGSRVINDDHSYGVLSFTDVIVRSSNVGAIKVALELGPQRINQYVSRFGFGRRSSPDFPGESPGIVWDPSKLTDSALASVAMGYQVGVTPLQMAAAVSSVANGGELVQPRVVRAVVRDGSRVPVPRKVVGRTVTPATAATLVEIMEAVVERGTGMNARVPGFGVAGKTGTAKKLVNRSYQGHSDYNVSFVGFVPSRQPAFTIIVVVDSPHAVSPYGSVVAAPIFQRIAESALRHYAIAPTLNAPPPVLVAARNEPQPVPVIGPTGLPPVVQTATSGDGPSTFPDLRGLSARDAVRTLTTLGVTARVEGAGVVASQRPLPGTPLDGVTSSTIWLDRRTASPVDRDAAP